MALAVVLLLAGVLRYYHLRTVPLGFQGDEAAAGLEAHRVMENGWIGLFSPASGGNPASIYYLSVIPIWLFGDTILSVRLLSATLDMLTVLVLYVVLRRSFGWGTAVLGSGFLAVSGWHIQFARIAFISNILWPLTVMIGAVALGEAVRTRSKVWWAVAGAGFASGIYAYNGHFLFLAVVAVAMAWIFFGWTAPLAVGLMLLALREPGWATLGAAVAGVILIALNHRLRDPKRLYPAMAFGAGFALIVWPMARFILENEDVYFGRGRRISIFRTEEWTAMYSWQERARFLAERYIDFWHRLALEPAMDGVAGSGSAGVVPVSALALAALGMVFGLVRRNNPLVFLGMLTVVLMPFAPMSSNDFALRRAMIMAPFLAMFCAIAIVEVIRSSWNHRKTVVVAVSAILLLVTINIGYRNINDYFTNTATSSGTRWVMGPELIETITYLDDLPGGVFVYFYSNRWPFHFENVRFLAPDAVGETRGTPYGPDSIDIDPSKGRPIFVLMGPHQALLPEIQDRYPGGTVIEGPHLTDPDTGPTYIAYELPADS